MDANMKAEDFQSSNDGSEYGPSLASHLQKQPPDFPIVGLKCIMEHQNEGMALTYSCSQCNVEGTMHLAAALAHIRGYKHIHKYLQSFYPEKLSAIGPECSKSEQLQQLIPMALEVMQLEGWTADQISKTKMYVKKPTYEDHIEKKIVRIEGKGLKEHINAWSKSEPLLGVEHIIENRHVGRPSELYYTCDLCSVSSTMISILSHLASGKHRTKYLQTYQPLEEATIPKELKGSERMMRIRDIAKEIVKKEGVKNFKVKMLKTDEFKPPVPIARQTDKKVIKRPYVDAPDGKFMANKMPRFGMGPPPPPPFGRANFLHRGGPYGMDRNPMFGRGAPRPMGPPLPPPLVPRDPYGYEQRQRYQPPQASFYEEEDDYLPPPLPQGRLTNDQILDSLVNFKIAGEEEASAALKASNILTQALLQYRLRDIGRPEPREAQMGFNRTRSYDDGYASDLPPMRSSGMSPLRMPRPPGPPRPGAMPMRAMASAGTASRMNDYSYSQYDSYM
ncbi:uncharacterized protein LOC144934622 isoform X1 [Lampetra fluviatilis]